MSSAALDGVDEEHDEHEQRDHVGHDDEPELQPLPADDELEGRLGVLLEARLDLLEELFWWGTALVCSIIQWRMVG